MRIGVGLNLLQPDSGGVNNYVLTLLRHWPRLAPDDPLVLFTFAHNEPLLATLPAEARRHEIRCGVQEDVFQHRDRMDVYFCPFGSLWPRPMPLPSVVMFHDMQERFFPQFFTAAQLQERFFHYDWSLRMADAVLTVSDFTRDSCVAITRIPRRKIVRVHHAPDELPPPEQPADWPLAPGEPFVFYPANFWDHKNHRGLVQALRHLRQRGRAIPCVCTGSRLGREEEWRRLVEDAGVGDLMHHLGHRRRAEISWLYQHARALVFPSLFEGFGIPVVEAMHAGCAVACSRTTSLPEVVGEAGRYFDPTDPAAIAEAIAELWDDERRRTELARRGRSRAEAFSATRLVAGHRQAFALARRRFHPWRHWYRDRILRPRSEVPRKELTPHERAAAQRLLHRSSLTH